MRASSSIACFLGTRLGAEVRDALAAFPQPVLTTAIHNRTEYAAALRVGPDGARHETVRASCP